MADEYAGHANYVVAGFLVEAFTPWLELVPDDEWGELMRGYHYVARKCLSVDDERSQLVMGWFITEYERYVEEDWYGDFESDDEFRERVAEARQSTVKAVEYWRKRAEAFKGSEALEDEVALLPEWALPSNPYERLEADLSTRESEVTEATKRLEAATQRVVEAQEALRKAREQASTG